MLFGLQPLGDNPYYCVPAATSLVYHCPAD